MTLDCTCNRLKEAEAKAAKWDAIIQCDECRYFDSASEACWHFKHFEQRGDYSWDYAPHWIEPGGFCAWGERREA